ncbi:hypothetical protein G3I71_07915 [Streptomyces sp. SID12501]|uniref:Uncharacterized protein n=2 Tax=Streptomyces sp. SID12501 TaxID=2706042 RepID=A0A6B3BM96_9ACTN|nr:hypothetical protein [Streptomyces sp. SID12501]
MIISFWHTQYVLAGGPVADAVVRINAQRLFRGEVGRDFWTLLGSGWRQNMIHEQRSRKFVKVLNEAFEAAQAEGPAVLASEFFLSDGAD